MTLVLDPWGRMVAPLNTKAAHWHDAACKGLRLPQHKLRCDQCGSPTERPPVCTGCLEALAEQQVSQ